MFRVLEIIDPSVTILSDVDASRCLEVFLDKTAQSIAANKVSICQSFRSEHGDKRSVQELCDLLHRCRDALMDSTLNDIALHHVSQIVGMTLCVIKSTSGPVKVFKSSEQARSALIVWDAETMSYKVETIEDDLTIIQSRLARDLIQSSSTSLQSYVSQLKAMKLNDLRAFASRVAYPCTRSLKTDLCKNLIKIMISTSEPKTPR